MFFIYLFKNNKKKFKVNAKKIQKSYKLIYTSQEIVLHQWYYIIIIILQLRWYS